jgi:hypothetical protein
MTPEAIGELASVRIRPRIGLLDSPNGAGEGTGRFAGASKRLNQSQFRGRLEMATSNELAIKQPPQ